MLLFSAGFCALVQCEVGTLLQHEVLCTCLVRKFGTLVQYVALMQCSPKNSLIQRYECGAYSATLFQVSRILMQDSRVSGARECDDALEVSPNITYYSNI